MEEMEMISREEIPASDEVINQVYKTDDLGKFNFHPKNRKVNPAHVDKLSASIAKNNLLDDQPILVNEHFDIIDGQHRLKAAMTLSAAISYILKEGLTVEDAITLNINTKNWTYRDYLKYWIDQGNEHYIYFKQFMRKYGLSYSISVGILGLGQATNGNRLTDIFNEGKFIPKEKEYAEDIGDKILEMMEYGSFANDRSFVLAFDEVMRMDEYDHPTFMKKLEMAPDRFTKCSNKENYFRMIEDVINYHNRGETIRLY